MSGPPKGSSRLPEAVQAVIEEGLRAGHSISAVARLNGISRDQVRTIKYRIPSHEIAGSPVSITDIEKKFFAMSMQIRYLKRRVEKLEESCSA